MESHYHFFRLTIGQINKLSKLGLYLIGLMALFDFIKWAKFMGGLKLVSGISIGLIRFAQGLSSAPILMWGGLIATVHFATRKLSKSEALVYPFIYVLSTSQRDAQLAMEGHPIVRYLGWLERQPITEGVIKKIAFGLFVVFALIELLTS